MTDLLDVVVASYRCATRFKEAGWTTWYEPSFTALHVKHGTSGDARGIALTVPFYRGMARLVAAHPRDCPESRQAVPRAGWDRVRRRRSDGSGCGALGPRHGTSAP